MGFFGGPRRSVVQDLDFGSAAPPREDSAALDPTGPLADFDRDAEAEPIDDRLAFATPVASPLADPWLTAAPADEASTYAEVDIIGNGYQVNGRLAIGRFDRLSDWLNMQQGWIHVEDGVLFHPGHEEPGAAKPRSSQWMRLDQVVLVCEKSRQQTPRQSPLQVQKARRRVTIVTPGYTLRGFVHLHEAGSMQQFLESPDPKFIAMTDVVVRWLLDETIVSHQPFALVNRDELISVSAEAPRAESDAEPAAEGDADAAEATGEADESDDLRRTA